MVSPIAMVLGLEQMIADAHAVDVGAGAAMPVEEAVAGPAGPDGTVLGGDAGLGEAEAGARCAPDGELAGSQGETRPGLQSAHDDEFRVHWILYASVSGYRLIHARVHGA